MNYQFHQIIESLRHIPWKTLAEFESWNYAFMFCVSILEATPVFWVIVPGQTFITLGGFLARMGSINLFYLIGISSLWAILGDFIGYFMGKKLWTPFLTKYGKYFFLSEDRLEKTTLVLHAHAGKAIIIGRFVGVIRSIVPFLAGATGIQISRFSMYNIFWGIAWGTSFVMLWFIFGHSYDMALRFWEKAILLGVWVAILVIVLKRMAHRAEEEI